MTVLTTDSQNDAKLINFTEIGLKWSYEYFSNAGKIVDTSVNIWNTMDTFMELMSKVSEAQMVPSRACHPCRNVVWKSISLRSEP